MHEASLARALLGAALDRAQREGARRVVRVAGWIAETEQLSRESIALLSIDAAADTELRMGRVSSA